MLLLLFAGGEPGTPDLSDPIVTPPVAGAGVVTQFPATSGAWRLSLEIAEPPGSTWYDLTPFYVGDHYQRGADDYKGKYRASLASVQLQIDSVRAADMAVSTDILAPWGQDTTDLFGDNIRLGAGLLMRLSMVREVASTVVEWLPLWTGRVESWGDASAARGQIRTHVVSVVDTLADLTNVPIQIDYSVADMEEYFNELLTQAAWPFGVDIYGDLDAAGGVLNDEAIAAINRLDQTTDPLGLVFRTLRSGRMVIHPAPWDTTNTERYPNPLLDTYPAGLKFSYVPDFTDIEYIADDDQQPFAITRTVAGILNSFVVTMPDDPPDPLVYAVDDPVSTGRYGVRPYTATWIINNPPAVDDLLADRAFSESQALPVRTTVDHEGFWTAMAIVDHLDPVTIVHANSADGLVVTGTGSIRNIVEERTVRADGLLNWQSTVQIDIDSTETSEPLLPVKDLALVSAESPLLGGPSTATFSWTNPTQPSITPTEVQYRVLGRSFIWLPKSYPGVGADGIVTYGLAAGTRYTFQVRLVRRVDGVVTNYSPWRQLEFTTPFLIYPNPVPDGDHTDGDFPQPDDECDDFTVELQENDGTGWTTVDTFTGSELHDNGDGSFSLTDPIPNSFFNDGSMYRFRTSCDGVTWVNGPEFDPPDDWTDPCPSPTALSVPPYNDPDLLVYIPKICTGAEDGDPDFIFQGMQIIEAVSGIPGAHGDALDEIQTGLASPGDHVLLALPQPAWGDVPAGIVAYGECPQIAGHTGDKTFGVKVRIADDTVDCVLFECAGMQIKSVAVMGGGWRAAVIVYQTGGTTTLPTATVLDVDTDYAITATFELATGDIVVYVDGVEDNSVGGSDNVPTITALPIWRVGAPPESWITNCAIWDRILDPGDLPSAGTGLVNAVHWWDFSNAASRTDVGGATTSITDLINGVVMVESVGSSVARVTTMGSTALVSGESSPAGLALERMTAPDLLISGSQPVWFSWVGQLPGSPNPHGTFWSTGAAAAFSNGNIIAGAAGTNITDGAEDTTAHVWYFELNGASSKLYKDGVLNVSGTCGSGTASGTASLFNVPAGGNGGTIRLGEVVMGNGTNTPTAIADEYTRLSTKWGV